MAIRGLVGLRKAGILKATYSHSSSNPEGLGSSAVEFCRALTASDMDQLFDKLNMVDDEGIITSRQIQAYRQYLPDEVWNEDLGWTAVLKYMANPLRPLLDGYDWMVEYGSFMGSMRCRWIYIIDLDSRKLEISINGLEKLGIPSDRDPKQYVSDEALIPVKLVGFPIESIPENWLEIVRMEREKFPTY